MSESMTTSILYYFHDPMCSWCYAFRPVWSEIRGALPRDIAVQRILGGLAPDSDTPMSVEMKATIQHHWHRIEETVPGTRFNFDFWTKRIPVRSTYPSCRAVIAAMNQSADMEEPMINAIQDAYYRKAENPSDYQTLVEIAAGLGLDAGKFRVDIHSSATDSELHRQIAFTSSIGVRGFPSLVLRTGKEFRHLAHSYTDAGGVLQQLK